MHVTQLCYDMHACMPTRQLVAQLPTVIVLSKTKEVFFMDDHLQTNIQTVYKHLVICFNMSKSGVCFTYILMSS